MTSKATKAFLGCALAAGKIGKPIYRVAFRSGTEPLLSMQAEANPVGALEALLQLAKADPPAETARALEIASQYLLHCCCPSDIDAIRGLIGPIDPMMNLATLSRENVVLFQMMTWAEDLTPESPEFFDCIVSACNDQDRGALDFWLDEKGIDATRSIPYFIDSVDGLPFLCEKVDFDLKKMSEKDFERNLQTGDSHRSINAFFASAHLRHVIHQQLRMQT